MFLSGVPAIAETDTPSSLRHPAQGLLRLFFAAATMVTSRWAIRKVSSPCGGS